MITEIVVGTAHLRLPEPWRWQHNKNGSWSAVNTVIETVVDADLRGDDGLQVRVDYLSPTPYVPAVVIALVVLANDDGGLSNMFQKMGRYVTSMPELEEIDDAD